jgi:hypothetical protein
MSTTLAAALLAFGGVVAVLIVAYAFYRIGRAEDRDRAAAEAARREHGPHAPPEHGPHASPGLARERSRPRPPRRRPH